MRKTTGNERKYIAKADGKCDIKIRHATPSDIASVCSIYDNIHTAEENGIAKIGWVRGIYPIRETAEGALSRGELFVGEADGKVVGTAIINHEQPEVYGRAEWKYELPDEKVMVLHTLVIDPLAKGCGYGKAFVLFYEQYARESGCESLRMDTNMLNENARAFYNRLGYTEVGIFPCDFNGIESINLVMLEKSLDR